MVVNKKKRSQEQRNRDIASAKAYIKRLEKAKASSESHGSITKDAVRSGKKKSSLSKKQNSTEEMAFQKREDFKKIQLETGSAGVDESESESESPLEKRRKTEDAPTRQDVINIRQWDKQNSSSPTNQPPISEVRMDSIITGNGSTVQQQVGQRKLPPASNSLPVRLDPTAHHDNRTHAYMTPNQPPEQYPTMGFASAHPRFKDSAHGTAATLRRDTPQEYDVIHRDIPREPLRRDTPQEPDAFRRDLLQEPLRRDIPQEYDALRRDTPQEPDAFRRDVPMEPLRRDIPQEPHAFHRPTGLLRRDTPQEYDAIRRQEHLRCNTLQEPDALRRDIPQEHLRCNTLQESDALRRDIPQEPLRRDLPQEPDAFRRALPQDHGVGVVKNSTPKPLRLDSEDWHKPRCSPDTLPTGYMEESFHFAEPVEDFDEVNSKSNWKRNILAFFVVPLVLSVGWAFGLPAIHSDSAVHFEPCFEDSFTDNHQGTEVGIPFHCRDVTPLPCPGTCKDGKLVSCGVHADVKQGTSCQLTSEARDIVSSFNNLLRLCTTTCALQPKCSHPFFVGTEGDRPLFSFDMIVERLGLSGVDYSVLDASNQYEEELFLVKKFENGKTGIGVHPSLPLPQSGWTAMKVGVKKVAKSASSSFIYLATYLVSIWLSLYRKFPFLVCVGSLGLVYFAVYQRSRRLVLLRETTIIKYRQRALNEIYQSNLRETTASAVLDRIVWDDFPNRQRERDRFASTIWVHVVADLEKDTRVRVRNGRENGKTVKCWKWVDSRAP